MMTLKEAKGHVRFFLRTHYTDERLAMLLAHAQSGRLAYDSCCCFVGVATADHGALACERETFTGSCHLSAALMLIGARDAELAYRYLSGVRMSDEVRRRILIPMVRAEIRRRDRLAEVNPPAAVRGIMNGILVGAAVWVAIGVTGVTVWRLLH